MWNLRHDAYVRQGVVGVDNHRNNHCGSTRAVAELPDTWAVTSPNGKVNLAAKAPRTAEGRPGLSGVWHVQAESLEEKRRLFGPGYGVNFVPGMEPTTTSKYAGNILLDFKPGEIVLTPAAEEIFRRRQRGDETLCRLTVCRLMYRSPRCSPRCTQIVQTPGLN